MPFFFAFCFSVFHFSLIFHQPQCSLILLPPFLGVAFLQFQDGHIRYGKDVHEHGGSAPNGGFDDAEDYGDDDGNELALFLPPLSTFLSRPKRFISPSRLHLRPRTRSPASPEFSTPLLASNKRPEVTHTLSLTLFLSLSLFLSLLPHQPSNPSGPPCMYWHHRYAHGVW